MQAPTWIQAVIDKAAVMKNTGSDIVALLQEYTDQGWDAAALAPYFPTATGITAQNFTAALVVLQGSIGTLATMRTALEKIIP